MWEQYLAAERDALTVSPYAAPGRADDLADIPAAFIQVNELHPLRDEGFMYAMKLTAAGVPVELYCAPNRHHGLAEDRRTDAQAARLYHEAIRAVIAT